MTDCVLQIEDTEESTSAVAAPVPAAAPVTPSQPEPPAPTVVEEEEDEIPALSPKDKVGFYLLIIAFVFPLLLINQIVSRSHSESSIT